MYEENNTHMHRAGNVIQQNYMGILTRGYNMTRFDFDKIIDINKKVYCYEDFFKNYPT